MSKFIKVLVASLSLIAFTACDMDDSVTNRIVGVDTGDQTSEFRDPAAENPDEEYEEFENEDLTNNQKMYLSDKILANSTVPQAALMKALNYFDKNSSKFSNKKYMGIVDYSQHSGNKRFYIIDLVDGSVEQLYTAHGSGSDKNHDGFAESFSNTSGSNQSSLGFVRGAETYYSSKFKSNALRLDGLETRNSKVRSRAIVIHGASYVSGGLSKMGRSQGCPAVEMSRASSVVKRLTGGSLIYLYHKSNP